MQTGQRCRLLSKQLQTPIERHAGHQARRWAYAHRAALRSSLFSGQFAPGVVLNRNSQFLVGSVTKLFVARIIWQLIANHPAHSRRHRWSLPSRMASWCTDNDRDVCLGHRSGMGDFGNDFSKQQSMLVLSNLNRHFTYDQVLDLVRAVQPVARPGQMYHYPNVNYIVLGVIVQRITHRTLGALIASLITRPLHLKQHPVWPG